VRIINFRDYVAHELARVSYKRQRLRLRWIVLVLAILAILALAIALVNSELWWAPLVLATATGGVAAVLGYYEWTYHRESQLRDQLRAGLRGQRLLPQVLAGLDDDYYLLNNLKLPGRADDIDHIVVGPNGLFALETKHHRGRIFWQDGQWYQSKVSRSGYRQPETPIRDPARQLKRNIDYLRSCINSTDGALARRTRLWIEGVVVFTHPAARLDLPVAAHATSTFPVLRVEELPAYITEHTPRQRHSKAEVRQIVSMLANLRSPSWIQPRGARRES
jgi:hypothetical protein